MARPVLNMVHDTEKDENDYKRSEGIWFNVSKKGTKYFGTTKDNPWTLFINRKADPEDLRNAGQAFMDAADAAEESADEPDW